MTTCTSEYVDLSAMALALQKLFRQVHNLTIIYCHDATQEWRTSLISSPLFPYIRQPGVASVLTGLA